MGGAIRLRTGAVGACVALLVVAATVGVANKRIDASIREAQQVLSLPVPRTCAELLPGVKRILVERYTAAMGHGPELKTLDMAPEADRQVIVTPWTGGDDFGTEGCRWSAALTPLSDGKCSIVMSEVGRHRGRKIGTEESGPPGWRIWGGDKRDEAMHWDLMVEAMPEALPWAARRWHRPQSGSCPRTQPPAPPVSN